MPALKPWLPLILPLNFVREFLCLRPSAPPGGSVRKRKCCVTPRGGKLLRQKHRTSFFRPYLNALLFRWIASSLAGQAARSKAETTAYRMKKNALSRKRYARYVSAKDGSANEDVRDKDIVRRNAMSVNLESRTISREIRRTHRLLLRSS